MFNDLCADVISQSALKNNANTIMSMFLTKALYDFKETSEIIITPNSPEQDNEYSVAEIRERYVLDLTEEE